LGEVIIIIIIEFIQPHTVVTSEVQTEVGSVFSESLNEQKSLKAGFKDRVVGGSAEHHHV